MFPLLHRKERPTPKREAWMPKRAGPPDPDAVVPEVYRGLRLRRTRKRRRMESSPVATIVFVTVLVIVGACAVIVFSSR